MNFTVHKYADVSTAEISDTDLFLLTNDAPYCIASYPGGAFFYTTAGCSAKDRVTAVGELKKYGFSDRFIEIWSEAGRQGLSYIRFDSDGAEIGED